MKKIYFLLLLFSGFSHAQIINFPDPAFKAKLLNQNAPQVAFDIQGNVLIIDANGDGEISVPEAQAVDQLYVRSSGITDLTGIANFTNLRLLVCEYNAITSLDVSMLNQLSNLVCNDNLISNLVINDTLEALNASYNSLTSIDLSNHLATFAAIYLNDNLLTSLTISNFTNLTADRNALTSLNVSGDYANLYCSSNQLTFLDLSNARAIGGIYAFDNPLSVLIMKNGFNDGASLQLASYVNASVYVCADEYEIAGLEALAAELSLTDWRFGSYCSFVPGGDYNTISGNTTFDGNNNGCDGSDIQSSLFKINFSDGIDTGSAFSDASGGYHFYTGSGTFTLTPAVENLGWFNFSPPTATISFPANDNSITVQDFCITANGTHPDLEIVLVPIGIARPGFDADYKIVYRNKGNQTQSGQINLNFEDSIADFVSSIPSVNIEAFSLLGWTFTDLHPFESGSINLKLNINSPTETPAVNSGDLLQFNAQITDVSGEETPLDNNFSLTQTVVNSQDPNDKTCLEGENVIVDSVGKYLRYNINFENTGTADAVNVVVKDLIDTTKFDIDSLQLLYASHTVETKITGNKVEFIFEDINLPPSSMNPIGGHGNVLFKIKTLEGLAAGTEVSNTAGIYFDYNAPIATNVARTTFTALAKTDFRKDNSITIYPNPAKNLVQVKADSNIQSIQLFDIEGRILMTSVENKNVSVIDISNYQNGIYFLKVSTQKGVAVEKVLKEN